ncbi:outer membrane beta-barrel protein [Marinoscillum furvescens]|uniref:Outer membrane protein with beta-barrel domain n=1 Tax=Marinoscillum furvescens DSM 4134 TaxID=1122208 RepID=A0A3D9KZJ1_MARFU|nr:outer membrane beta-barrel protein [Marinoscillum furvescens]RED95566.1 outer membrane protein with beta-barrel domain [Marinoscillum furvescens DSM 4134]
MKNLIFITLLTLLIGFTAQAQISEGLNYFSGQISYSSINSDSQSNEDNEEVYGAGLSYGHFLGEKTALGFSASFTQSDELFVFGALAVRRYKPIDNKLYSFVEGYTGAARLTDIGNQYFIGVRPGISYFLNEKWAIEATLGGISYSSFRYDDIEEKTTQFELGLFNDLAFSLSIYY